MGDDRGRGRRIDGCREDGGGVLRDTLVRIVFICAAIDAAD